MVNLGGFYSFPDIYKTRITDKEWREILLNEQDKLIINCRIRRLKSKPLGCGVREIYLEPLGE